MIITPEQVVESLLRGNSIADAAMAQTSGGTTAVGDIIAEQGLELSHEGGYYAVRGAAKLVAANAAKIAAEKARANAVLAQERAEAAQKAADAAAARAAATPVEQPTPPFPPTPPLVPSPAVPPFVEPPIIPTLSPERPTVFAPIPPPPFPKARWSRSRHSPAS